MAFYNHITNRPYQRPCKNNSVPLGHLEHKILPIETYVIREVTL